MTYERPSYHQGFRVFVEACLPGTSADIEAKAGVHRATVLKWLKQMHHEGACHITGWQFIPGNRYLAIYTAGKGRDAQKPRAKTKAETSKTYRKRHPEKAESYNTRRRATYHADKKLAEVKGKPQSWLSALMQ